MGWTVTSTGHRQMGPSISETFFFLHFSDMEFNFQNHKRVPIFPFGNSANPTVKLLTSSTYTRVRILWDFSTFAWPTCTVPIRGYHNGQHYLWFEIRAERIWTVEIFQHSKVWDISEDANSQHTGPHSLRIKF